MNNMLKLDGSIGPDDEDDNNPDDIRKIQNSLTEIGRTPFHRSFREGEHPGNEIERFQLDKDLQIDGRARRGGETERTLNNELLRRRDEDKRTFGGLLSDPRVDKPVGFGEVGKSNTVQDIRRSENTLTRLGFAPRNEPMPTDLMRASAIGKSLIDLQSSAGLEADGVMNPGGPTEREVTRRLDEKKQLAKAAAAGLGALKGAGGMSNRNKVQGDQVAAGIFERLFAPALSGGGPTADDQRFGETPSRSAQDESAAPSFAPPQTAQVRTEELPPPPPKPRRKEPVNLRRFAPDEAVVRVESLSGERRAGKQMLGDLPIEEKVELVAGFGRKEELTDRDKSALRKLYVQTPLDERFRQATMNERKIAQIAEGYDVSPQLKTGIRPGLKAKNPMRKNDGCLSKCSILCAAPTDCRRDRWRSNAAGEGTSMACLFAPPRRTP